MTEDLQYRVSDKDVSRSCIFVFPDRPVDTLPPDLQPPHVPPPTPIDPYDPWVDWPNIPPNEHPVPGIDPFPPPVLNPSPPDYPEWPPIRPSIPWNDPFVIILKVFAIWTTPTHWFGPYDGDAVTMSLFHGGTDRIRGITVPALPTLTPFYGYMVTSLMQWPPKGTHWEPYANNNDLVGNGSFEDIQKMQHLVDIP